MPAQLTARDLLQLPGRKVPVMARTVLPAIVVGMSAASAEPQIAGLIALGWLILVPFSLYKPWAAIALPFVGGALLVFALFALPFNSAPFVVDFWTSVLLIILGLPRPQRGG
jgi:membrane-bound ClpP family serine protease